MMAVGSIRSGQKAREREATNEAIAARQRAKEAAYRKTPAYRAQVKAQHERRRLQLVQQQRARAAKRAEEKRQARAVEKAAQDRVDAIAAALKGVVNNTEAGQLIDGVTVEHDNTLNLQTTSTWDLMPYRTRLQLAQSIFRLWDGICTKDKVDAPFMRIQDATGNRVGGYDGLSGVWVVEQ